ncbi:MAG: dihydropteroate synthase [Myxococcota bacterium]|nr:dihydropteroate synthase [Myxococcota bacterium]
MIPRLAGILNLTPDSFSDGGRYLDPQRAIARGLKLREEGADWVDVGGESTRPGAEPVPVEEELRRVVPVVAALTDAGIPVSIDTRRHQVASEALRAGAVVLNDISGFRDPRMVELAAEHGAGAVVMHMRGEPQTMQRDTDYADLLGAVRDFLRPPIQALQAAGVQEIWADPGIGFGKSTQGNLELLRRLPELDLGVPLYVGASRKRFIAEIAGDCPADQRLGGSLAAAALAYKAGAQVLRVHDIAQTRQLLRVLEAGAWA